MTANHHSPTAVSKSGLPHPAVLVVALLLALAGAWCWLAGAGADESVPARSTLREQAAEDRAEYLRATRQAAVTRSRLLETQQRLETFTSQRFDELHRAAEGQSADSHAEPSPIEPQNIAAAPPSAQQLEAERLRGRLTELGHERSRLLERLTVEHPLVHDVESQMADVRRLLEAIPPPAELPPSAAPSNNQNVVERQAQQRLRHQWQELVDEAAAGSGQLEQECRLVEQELAAIEARRAKAEKSYLASAESLTANASLPLASAPASMNWGAVLLACACGVPLVAVAGRTIAQSVLQRDRVIRQASDIERLFNLPVIGLIAAGDAGVVLATEQPRPAVPLVLQLLAAMLVCLLVAMTVGDPRWLTEISSHPIDAFRHALGNLGGH